MTSTMQIFFGPNSIMWGITGLIFSGSFRGFIFGFIAGMVYDLFIGNKNRDQQRQSQSQSQRQRRYQSDPFQDFRRQFQQQYQGTGYQRQYQSVSQTEFSQALLVLSAEVMKADGKVLKSELAFVKQFLTQQFGPNQAPIYLQELRGILQKNINFQTICSRLNSMMPKQQKSILVQYLFGIAQSDGTVSNKELDVISKISYYLGIAGYEFEQLKGMFWKDAANAYKALGIKKDATDSEIKKAYRKMAREHHPDKYATSDDSTQKAAKEKFQKIQEAYEDIKKERGF